MGMFALQNISPNDFRWDGVSVLVYDLTGIYLIRRHMQMPTHPGPIAGFGGYKKQLEIHPYETARREFFEETTLSPDCLEFEGLLSPIFTTHDTLIFPVVAKLKQEADCLFKGAQSNGEWDLLFKLNHQYWLSTIRWQIASRSKGGEDKNFYFLALPKEALAFQREEKLEYLTLWGATAKMLWDLKQCEARG